MKGKIVTPWTHTDSQLLMSAARRNEGDLYNLAAYELEVWQEDLIRDQAAMLRSQAAMAQLPLIAALERWRGVRNIRDEMVNMESVYRHLVEKIMRGTTLQDQIDALRSGNAYHIGRRKR